MAEVDYILNIEGIEGESGDPKHKCQIEIDSWNWSARAPKDAGSGQSTGRAQAGELNFTTKSNKSSPQLVASLVRNKNLSAQLVCRKAGKVQQEFMTIKLTEARVSSYSVSAGQGSIVPVDQFSLNFARIDFEYKPQKADGSLGSPGVVSWNLHENR